MIIPFTPQEFELLFRELSSQVPLEVFSFGGSLLEEIVSPIPAYLVMGIIGSLAFAQKLSFSYVLFLALLGAVGKSLGSILWYYVGDTLEDVMRGTLARLFKTSPEQIENFGKRFTGAHWKDGGFIFLFRVFPLTPVTPFSIACGVLKIDFRVYIIATFLGNLFKDILYVALGYYGVASMERLWREIHSYKLELEWVLFFIAVGIVLTFFFQSDIWKNFRKKSKAWISRFR